MVPGAIRCTVNVGSEHVFLIFPHCPSIYLMIYLAIYLSINRYLFVCLIFIIPRIPILGMEFLGMEKHRTPLATPIPERTPKT